MNEIECPYCEQTSEVEPDGEYGTAQHTAHEIECDHCKKNFVFTTVISFDYYPRKADCLNGSPHRLTEWSKAFPEIKRKRCLDCGWSEPPKNSSSFWPTIQ